MIFPRKKHGISLEIFPLLEEGWEKHKEGEYYHTGALKTLARENKVVFKWIQGQRLDTREPDGFLQALLA